MADLLIVHKNIQNINVKQPKEDAERLKNAFEDGFCTFYTFSFHLIKYKNNQFSLLLVVSFFIDMDYYEIKVLQLI